MKPSVYIETSVVSYLAARTSHDLLVAACQGVTRDWWDHRARFELFVSELVLAEAGKGDDAMAAARLQLLAGVPVLATNAAAERVATAVMRAGALPASANADAMHIALAAVHRVSYLATWNCRHIDNPAIKPHLRRICARHHVILPEICSPLQLLEVTKHEQ